MTIKDIYNLMDMCRRFKFESSDTSGKSPEEVRAYAEGYIRCKSCVMAVLNAMKGRMERANEPTKVLIEDCDFSVRTYNCLKRAGMKTLGDIKSVEQLQNVRNLGKRCVNEVVDKLMEYGIELPESEGQNESRVESER